MDESTYLKLEKLEVDVEILTSALQEAEEMLSALNSTNKYLRRRNSALEDRLATFGIDCSDIDESLETE